jgi:hypothetical protein
VVSILIVKLKDSYAISIVVGDGIMHLQYVEEWTKWLTLINAYSPSTVKDYVSSLERFWLWSLANEKKEEEKLIFHLANYRKALETGFQVSEKTKHEQMDAMIELIVVKSKPKTNATVIDILPALSLAAAVL